MILQYVLSKKKNKKLHAIHVVVFKNLSLCLQIDTFVALEVKAMKKWEFSCIDQCLNDLSTCFFGTESEI